MTGELILHIGQPKTGTTALQAALTAWRPRLATAGFAYPQTPIWRDSHHALVPALVGLEHCPAYITERLGPDPLATSEQALGAALAEFAASGARSLILSSEALFSARSEAAFARVRAVMARFERVRVLAWLRAPGDFLAASLSTQLQAFQPAEAPPVDARRAALEPYLSTPAKLVIRPFEREHLAGGNVVSDFAAITGAPLRPVSSGRNARLSAEALALCEQRVHAGGRLTPGQLAWREALRRADRLLPGKPARLTRQMEEAVLRGTVDLQWLNKTLGFSFDGVDLARAGTEPGAPFATGTPVAQILQLDARRQRRLAAMMAPLGWLG
ncbi:hypothetical protein ACXN5S_05080 [Pseudoroseicyclus sp. H15]